MNKHIFLLQIFSLFPNFFSHTLYLKKISVNLVKKCSSSIKKIWIRNTGNFIPTISVCALDIKVKEQSDENLARGRKIFEPPRFMSCQQAATQLLQAIQSTETATPETAEAVRTTWLLEPGSQVVCVARVGGADQRIVACSLEEAATLDMGSPLHSLVIPGMPWSV